MGSPACTAKLWALGVQKPDFMLGKRNTGLLASQWQWFKSFHYHHSLFQS